MGKKNEYIMTIRLTNAEESIVKRLKKNYSINISQYLRNKLIELDIRLRDNIGGEL